MPDAIRLSADELRVWAEGIDAVEIPVLYFHLSIFRRLLTTYNVSAEEKGESLVLCVRPPLEEDGTSVADFCLF